MMSTTPVDLSIDLLCEWLCRLVFAIEKIDLEQQERREKLAQALLTYEQEGKESGLGSKREADSDYCM